MRAAITISVLAGIALSAANVVLGPLNQDEGWYLLASLNTASGMMPYRDYFFTQGPVLPYVYAWLSPLWAPAGVLGGRILTALMGLVSAGFCAGIAYRITVPEHRRFAALTAWLMTAVCPVFSYFTAIPKTYALSALFITAGFFTLTGRRSWRFERCAVLLAFASGTRLSLGILLAVVGFGLLVVSRRKGYQWAWLRFGIAGGIALLLLFGPFAVCAADGLLFSQQYHASRVDAGMLNWLVLRAGFVSRLVQGYFTLVVAFLVVVAARFHEARRLPVEAWIMAVGFLAVSLVHVIAPFPYDDYQTSVMPLAAALCGALLAGTRGNAVSVRKKDAGVYAAVLCALLFAVASPLCMDWVLIRKDRFWFEMKDEPDVFKLRKAAALLRTYSEGNEPLLTQDAYLAVEAGMKVVPGLEMGPFSLFPDLDDETAQRVHVHNVATLERTIEKTNAKCAALSGYAFAVSCPTTEQIDPEVTAQLRAAVEHRYQRVAMLSDFGQGHTQLEVYRRIEPNNVTD